MELQKGFKDVQVTPDTVFTLACLNSRECERKSRHASSPIIEGTPFKLWLPAVLQLAF